MIRVTLRNSHPTRRPNLLGIKIRLKKFVKALPNEDRRVDFLFVSDAIIKDLGGRYRANPHPTDVLAFSYPEGRLMGEVAISLDTAARQARDRHVPLKHELCLLSVHGLLHILGERDESYFEWCHMKTQEFNAMVKLL